MTERTVTSRLAGFYREPLAGRLRRLFRSWDLTDATVRHLEHGGGLSVSAADRMSENVVAVHGLPLSLALNFRVNGRDVLIPMAVEEPSVVAAASNAARLIRISGGFHGTASPSVMTTQIQLDDVPESERAYDRVVAARSTIASLADASIPSMVHRGGGFRGLEVRVLDRAEGVVCIDLFVDVGDAMGANVVDTVAEAVAPEIQRRIGGEIGLRILSNLPTRRMVEVSAHVGDDALGGLAPRIARASRFAELDPSRAVTHNKGILNGVDAAAVALGQDWRSIEAAAHGFASIGSPDGRYRPLATWTRTRDGLAGRLAMPLAVGTVGGSTHAHEGIRAAFDVVKPSSAQELAVILASVGLASNLAALKALAGEGIQKGHMRLHDRKRESEVVTAVSTGGAVETNECREEGVKE